MKDKKPYNLKHLVMIYNVFQIVLSIFIAVIVSTVKTNDK